MSVKNFNTNPSNLGHGYNDLANGDYDVSLFYDN